MLRLSLRGYATAAAALAITITLAGGCSTTPTAVPYVATPVGTTWTGQHTNSGSFGSGTSLVTMRAGERMWEGQRVLTHESASGVMLTRVADGLRIGFLGPDGKPQFLLSPPIGPQFPLAPGKAWTDNTMMTLFPSGTAIPVESEWRVHDFEDVTVPAGTFKAWKLSWKDSTGESETRWISPAQGIATVKRHVERTASHPQGPGVLDAELICEHLERLQPQPDVGALPVVE